jgi:phosphoadenosine phosphosulfate reductase
MDPMNLPDMESLALASAEDRLRWAAQTFPGTAVVTSSFGADSAVLLHLLSRAAPQIPVLFLNTGFLFAETLRFKEALTAQLGLDVREIRPEIGPEEFLERHGPAYEESPNFCCDRNKVQPLRKALEGVSCWIAGVRRDQTQTRARLGVVERQPAGMLKLHPLIDWDQQRIDRYLDRHGLPRNPLVAEGYTSIGCWPCTALPADLSDLRSGRWANSGKTECGLHLPFERQDGTPAATVSHGK